VDKDLPKAQQFTDQAVKISQAYPPDRDAVSALIQQGIFHMFHGELEPAEKSFYRTLTVLDAKRPPTNHDRSQIYTYLGQTQRGLQKFDAAERSHRLAYQVAQAVGGADHELTLVAQMDLGWFLFDTSRPTEGLALMASAKDKILKTRPNDPQTVPYALNRYGRALLLFGRVEEGNEVLSQAAENLRKYRPGSGYLATVLDLQAPGLTELGRYQEAQTELDEAAKIHTDIHDDPIYINENLAARSQLLLATGRTSEAAKVLDGFFMQESPPGTISATWARASLARANIDLWDQKPQQAVELAARVRAAIERSPSRAYFKNYEAQAALAEGNGLLHLKRSADALPLLKRAVELSSELYDNQRGPALADSQTALANCFIDLGEPAQARVLLAQAKAVLATHQHLGQHVTHPLDKLERRIAESDKLRLSLKQGS
jgi:tetratricopeptide (TPR) repeat protein